MDDNMINPEPLCSSLINSAVKLEVTYKVGAGLNSFFPFLSKMLNVVEKTVIIVTNNHA